MPSISQLVSTKEHATIDVGGLTLNVVYQPNKMTMSRMAALQKKASASDIDAVSEIILEILAEWDIEGPLEDAEGNELVADGKPAPVTLEVIGALPGFFVIELSGKLQELVTEGANPTGATPRSRKR